MKIRVNDVHPVKKTEQIRTLIKKVINDVARMENNNRLLSQCPICNGQIDFFTNINGFDLFSCNDCEHIFCNPYPTYEQLNRCYNGEIKKLENEIFLETFDKRVEIFLPRVDLLCRLKKDGKLLDIGSAVGVFIDALEKRNSRYHITCCDISRDSCEQLRKKNPDQSINIICDDFMNLDESSNNKFDIITLWDTIEHIIDVDGLLGKIKRLLNPNGIIAFSTPNTQSFEWSIAGTNHPQLTPPTHLNLFNTKSAHLLLNKNGFNVIEQHSLNASIDISFVKNLIKNKQAPIQNIGNFFQQCLNDPMFDEMLEKYLVSSHKAGNLIFIAKFSQ